MIDPRGDGDLVPEVARQTEHPDAFFTRQPREPIGETYARAARAQGAEISAWRIEDAFRRVFAAAEPMVFPGEEPAKIPERERAWWRERIRATFRAADATARFADIEAFFAALWEHFARAESLLLARLNQDRPDLLSDVFALVRSRMETLHESSPMLQGVVDAARAALDASPEVPSLVARRWRELLLSARSQGSLDQVSGIDEVTAALSNGG